MKNFKVFGFAALLICAAAFSQAAFSERSRTELPTLGAIKPFELLDSQKNEFSSDTLRGKIWMASFFFTNCPGICPIINGKVAALHARLKDNKDFKIVSITVDPMRDGPTALRNYAEKFKADTDSWHFLTGSNVDVEKVLEEHFHLTGEEASIAHTDNILLIDEQMRVRGRYAATKAEDFAALERDIASLLAE